MTPAPQPDEPASKQSPTNCAASPPQEQRFEEMARELQASLLYGPGKLNSDWTRFMMRKAFAQVAAEARDADRAELEALRHAAKYTLFTAIPCTEAEESYIPNRCLRLLADALKSPSPHLNSAEISCDKPAPKESK